MQFRAFYEAVLPVSDDEFYILWGQKRSRTIAKQGFEDFLEAAHTTGMGRNWYFATAAFNAPKRLNTNVTRSKALRLDIDAGPDKHDPEHPEKAYESTQAALAALVGFVQATDLRPSFIVRSGYGLHVYFALTTPVDPERWSRMARGLAAMCAEHGLHVDPSVTSDRGRLLRTLGSTHYSGATVELAARPGPIHDPAALEARLGTAQTQEALTATPSYLAAPETRQRAREMADAVVTMVPYKSSFVLAAKRCAVMRDAIERPQDMHHDTWFKMMVLADNSVEGRGLAHTISARDVERYDADELDRRLDTFEADFVTCESISHSAPQCASCEFFGRIKGPKELGRMPDEAAPGGAEDEGFALDDDEEDDRPEGLPADFPSAAAMGREFKVRREMQRMWIEATQTKTRKNPVTGTAESFVVRASITDDIFYFTSWVDATMSSHVGYTMRVRSRSGTWTDHIMESGIEVDNRALISFLSKHGVHPKDSKPETFRALQAYTMNLLNDVKNKTQRPAARERLGYQYAPDRSPVFVQGVYAVNAGGQLLRAQRTPIVAAFGDDLSLPSLGAYLYETFPDSVWDEVRTGAVTFADGLREAYARTPMSQLVLLLAAASIFMPFVAEHSPNPLRESMPTIGGVVSLHSSRSGMGKSSLQTIAGMMFYNPSKLRVTGSTRTGASLVATAAIATTLGSLPMVMDEVTTNDPGATSELVYMMANGYNKRKLEMSGAKLQDPKGWSLTCIMSTNASQRDMLSYARKGGTAEQLRLLELDFDRVPLATASEVARFREILQRKLDPNLGLLGLMLARQGMSVGFEELRRRALAAQGAIETSLGLNQNERFFSRMAAAGAIAHGLLTELGLVFYDFKAAMAEFRRAIIEQREYIAQNIMDERDMIAAILRENAHNMYVTEFERDARGAGSTNAEHPIQEPKGACTGRFVLSKRVAYLSIAAVRSWCKENAVSISTLERTAVAQGFVAQVKNHKGEPTSRVQMLLTKGIKDAPSLRSSCWMLDLTKIDMDIVPAAPADGSNVVELQARERHAPEQTATG